MRQVPTGRTGLDLSRRATGLAGLVLLAMALATPATSVERCQVPPFRNLVGPGGAQATMTIINDGGSCRIVNYLDSRLRTLPDALQTLIRPQYGTVRITQPGTIAYRPSPGFIGIDEFAYAGTGRSRDGRLVELNIRVTVKVLAPPSVQADSTP